MAGAMYLRTVFGSIAERRAQLADPASRMPVLAELDYVDHSDRSPCHLVLLVSPTGGCSTDRWPERGIPSHQGIP